MKKTVQNAKINWDNAGNLVSTEFNDPYYSLKNAFEETQHVFLTPNKLLQRWTEQWQHPLPEQTKATPLHSFVIAETGFGTGLNFLTCWQLFHHFLLHTPCHSSPRLHFISIEKYPLCIESLKQAHQNWPMLAPWCKQLQKQYPQATAGCHRLEFEHITLDLWFGDINTVLPEIANQHNGIVDAWFLDGFAPSKNPEMWQQTLFKQMARLSKDKASFATFTAASAVRKGLIKHGFTVSKIAGYGGKREMLTGIYHRGLSDDLEHNDPAPWYQRCGVAPQRLQRCSGQGDSSIAIIGGGIASAALSYRLCQQGYNVTLYCQDSDIAQNASGNRQGAIYPLLNGDHDGLSQFFHQAFEYTLTQIEALKQSGIRVPFYQTGVTQLGFDSRSISRLEALKRYPFSDHIAHYLSAAQTNNTTGITLNMPAIFYPLGGWVDAAQFTRCLFDAAAKTGNLTTLFKHKLEQIELQPSQEWQLQFSHKSCSHPVVILSCGHTITQLRQTAQLPLSSVRGQVSHIKSKGELTKLKTVLCYKGYLTPASDDPSPIHHLGASHLRNDVTTDFSEAEQRQNRDQLTLCLPDATSLINSINIDDNKARVAIRCASRDHLPLVGQAPQYQQTIEHYRIPQQGNESSTKINSLRQAAAPVYPNLYMLAGLGSRGLCSALLCSEILTAQITNTPQPIEKSLLDKLNPNRFWIRKLLKGRPV